MSQVYVSVAQWVWLTSVLFSLSLQAMNLPSDGIQQANLALYTLCEYTPNRQDFSFELALKGDRDKLESKLKDLAFGRYPDVHAQILLGLPSPNQRAGRVPDIRAQLFLGLWALREKRNFEAEYFLGCAAAHDHPVGQEKLGRLYIEQSSVAQGFELLFRAARIRLFHCDFPLCFSSTSRWYVHKPAVDFLKKYACNAELVCSFARVLKVPRSVSFEQSVSSVGPCENVQEVETFVQQGCQELNALEYVEKFTPDQEKQFYTKDALSEAIVCLKCVPKDSEYFDEAYWKLVACYCLNKKTVPQAFACVRERIERARIKVPDQRECDAIAHAVQVLTTLDLSPEDMFYGAHLYGQGIPGVLKADAQKSLKLRAKAAECTYFPALMALGRQQLHDGKMDKAYDYFKKAFDASSGNNDKQIVKDDMMALAQQNNVQAALWVFEYEKKHDRIMAETNIAKFVTTYLMSAMPGKAMEKKLQETEQKQIIRIVQQARANNNYVSLALGVYYSLKGVAKVDTSMEQFLKAVQNFDKVDFSEWSDDPNSKALGNFVGAIYYKFGDYFGGHMDYQKAESYLRKASFLGYGKASKLLSHILCTHEEVEKYSEGLQLLVEQADDGPDAAYYWAYLMTIRPTFQKVFSQKSDLFIKRLKQEASSSDDPCYAIELLGMLGHTVALPAIDGMKKRLQKRLENNDASAYYTLGRLFGLHGDREHEYEYLCKARNLGFRAAKARLGLWCLDTFDVDSSHGDEAIHYFFDFFFTQSNVDSTEIENLQNRILNKIDQHSPYYQNLQVKMFWLKLWAQRAKDTSSQCCSDMMVMHYHNLGCYFIKENSTHSLAKKKEIYALLSSMYRLVQSASKAFLVADLLQKAYFGKCSLFKEDDDVSCYLIMAKEVLGDKPDDALLDPESRELKKRLHARVSEHLGTIFLQQKNYDYAIKEYEEVLKLHPGHYVAQILSTIWSEKKHNVKKFLEVMEHAAQHDNMWAQFDLFIIYKYGVQPEKGYTISPDAKKMNHYYALMCPTAVHEVDENARLLNCWLAFIRDALRTGNKTNIAVLLSQKCALIFNQIPESSRKNLVRALLYFVFDEKELKENAIALLDRYNLAASKDSEERFPALIMQGLWYAQRAAACVDMQEKIKALSIALIKLNMVAAAIDQENQIACLYDYVRFPFLKELFSCVYDGVGSLKDTPAGDKSTVMQLFGRLTKVLKEKDIEIETKK